MTEPNDISMCRVIFEGGEFIEARRLIINFDTREVTLEQIGDFNVDFKMPADGITFLPEIEPCRIFCDTGELIIPFPKSDEILQGVVS